MPDASLPPKPNNLHELKACLSRSRSSQSSEPGSPIFEEYQTLNNDAQSEMAVMIDVIPHLAGSLKHVPHGYNTEFTITEHFNPVLSNPKPDVYFGTFAHHIDHKVRVDLKDYIQPTANPSLPMAPNFFLETKGPNGSVIVATRQAVYDGAIGAQAMHRLQNYDREVPIFDNNAYTMTSTYHAEAGTYRVFATHPQQDDAGNTHYYTQEIKLYGMTSDAEEYGRGKTAMRNAREWTEQQRNRLIQMANERARATAPSVVDA